MDEFIIFSLNQGLWEVITALVKPFNNWLYQLLLFRLGFMIKHKKYRNDIRPTPPRPASSRSFAKLICRIRIFESTFLEIKTKLPPFYTVDFTCYIPIFRECMRSTCKNLKRQHMYKIFWRCVTEHWRAGQCLLTSLAVGPTCTPQQQHTTSL